MGKTAKKSTSGAIQPLSFLELSTAQALSISAVFALLYFLYSFISDGFYQDDEVAHFQNMVGFWNNPESILGNWAKPGFKIFYVVPALLGHPAVLLLNSIITAATAFVSWRLATAYNIKNNALVLVLCGFQPMLFQLSFRTYSELITGFLLVLLVLSMVKDRFVLAALLGSYLFTIRQELIVFAPLVFGWLVWKKAWKSVPVMVLPPLALLAAGWLGYGDPLWVLTEMQQKGTDTNFVRQGFFHYWKMFTPVFGSVVTALFLAGFVRFFVDVKTPAARVKWLYILVPALLYFLIHCVLTSEFANMSSSAGNLRYLVVLSPLIAVVAGFGLDRLQAAKSFSDFSWITVFVYSVVVMIFLSFEYDHLRFTAVRDQSRWIALVLFSILLLFSSRKNWSGMVTTSVLAAVLIGATLYNEPPKKNSPENKTVALMADWLKQENLMDRKILINHTMFYFYAGRQFRDASGRYPGLYMRFLEEAKTGDLAIWDSHYSDRPEYKMDVPIAYFQKSTDWVPLRRFTSADQRYVAFVFERK